MGVLGKINVGNQCRAVTDQVAVVEMSVGFESRSNQLVVASGIEGYRAITSDLVVCELCILRCDDFPCHKLSWKSIYSFDLNYCLPLSSFSNNGGQPKCTGPNPHQPRSGQLELLEAREEIRALKSEGVGMERVRVSEMWLRRTPWTFEGAICANRGWVAGSLQRGCNRGLSRGYFEPGAMLEVIRKFSIGNNRFGMRPPNGVYNRLEYLANRVHPHAFQNMGFAACTFPVRKRLVNDSEKQLCIRTLQGNLLLSLNRRHRSIPQLIDAL